MELSTVEILIHQLEAAGFDGDIHITGFGEPTLHPNILDIIEICSDKFCTEMITNGDRLLAKKLNHRDLKSAGLNTLIVDCYDGEEHVSQMKEILSDCQIYYRIRDHHDNGEPELFKLYNFNNRGGLLNHSESLLRPCWLPFYKAFVDWDGEVRLCCNDWARSQPGFGNVHRERFDEIWMSENFVEIRKQLNTGHRQDLLACKNCDTCGTQNGFESVRIWQETF
jgi:MoaA/NifB/PqqE/SkfB family radical SAM enzyme